jgi:glycosyltransferase involved in cell wall biosynthesis
MSSKVSIVGPVYDAMPYFETFLGSVAKQTWRPLEAVFAFDGPTDGSFDCFQRFLPELENAGITVQYLMLPHRGQAAAVNDALKLVTGDFLTWCDADDEMLPECIAKKADWLDRHPGTGMVRNDGYVIDGTSGKIMSRSARENDRHTQRIFDGLLDQTVYCYAGCYMVRMSLFRECYPDLEIPLSPEGQNLQLLLPPASRSECGFVDDILHYYYIRPTGHSSRKRSFSETLKRLEGFMSLSREILKHCDCDRDIYEKKIDLIREKRLAQLRYSAVIRAREEIGRK